MAKTRSQVSHLQVKKEVREDKLKLEQLLHDTRNASNSKNKIIKNRASKTKPIQTQNAKVKSENTEDNNVDLVLPMRTSKTPAITTEQIAEVIGYIVNNKMSVDKAARKARMTRSTVARYYQEYMYDPEHKIPFPKSYLTHQLSRVTQAKIEALINYIVHNKMNLTHAAIKANLCRTTAYKYYTEYMEDPDGKIPVLYKSALETTKSYTQKHIKELISYIVEDGMTITAASKKANVCRTTARRYYLKYLSDPNNEIPIPGKCTIVTGKPCTEDQIKTLIGCIMDDGISLPEAAIISDMSENTARKYYKQYLEDPNHNIPTPKYNSYTFPSLDQMRIFFSCVIIDKSSVRQASLKAKISNYTGQEYYTRYLKNPTKMEKSADTSYSVEKMKKLVEYIQNDKMSISSAAHKANLGYYMALNNYHRYLKNPQLGIPKAKYKQLTQEDIKRLIDYIENDKMSMSSAARRSEIRKTTACKYYCQYKKDPEHKIPVPGMKGPKVKHKEIDRYWQIVADIYKNNPPIKPIHECYLYPESSLLDVNIKLELLDEDTKMILKGEK